MDASCSDLTSNHGGYLSIEDGEGSTETSYLEYGFFDFLNKVTSENMILITLCKSILYITITTLIYKGTNETFFGVR